jgi:pimeloyl-ACP methyl ester carboxylesterase
MPTVSREGGVELHWEERGSGPLVVIAVHWSGHPSVFEPLIEQLVPDHRIVTYDARGTGSSTRVGPHDIATGAADLAAVANEAGGSAVVVTISEGCNRAVLAADREPGAIAAVVAPATVPLPHQILGEADALVASDSVADGFIQMLETDYRAAQRTMMTSANPQLNEQQIRERVDLQVAYCPRETAVARVRAWREDDPRPAARALGDRLWLLSTPQMAGPWWPVGPKLNALIAKHLPEARVEEVEDGVVSRPDLTAGVVRRITARLQAPA